MDVNPASRDLNDVYVISLSHDAFVNYSVEIVSVLNLSGGELGTVYLEYADNDAFDENVTEVSRIANGNTGTLTIGLSTTQTQTGNLCGMIPYAKRVRIRTENTTGTPDFTYRSGQEAVI